MDSTEINKIAGATIGALLVFLLLNFFSGLIYGTRGGEHAVTEGEEGPVLAYAVAVEATEGAGEAEEPQIDLHAVLASADPAAGEKAFRACGACHSAEQGEVKVGPPLYDVVGHDIASVEGFSYSDAMLAHEGAWTPALLFDFLHDPKAVVPGTKMSYAGMKDPADRANIIAYLNETGGSPVDLTEGIEPLAPAGDAAEAEAGTEVAATGGGAAATGADAEEGAVTGAPGEDQGAGAETGEAPPVVTPESATETTTSSMPPAQPDVTVTDVETVDVGDENVQVGSTTPLAIEESVGAPAASEDSGPAAQPATEESPAAADEGQQVAAAPTDAGTTLGGDTAAGEKIFRRCRACHKIEEGQNAIGPSLYGVVGRDIASVADFDYSDAMAAQEGAWTPERLMQFIGDPKGTVPGNKMAFAGVKDEQDRTDLITYLQTAAE